MATIYLTNAASVAAIERGTAKPETAACVGPGRVLSIMRWPRRYPETGVGRVLALTPPGELAAPAIRAKKASDAGDDIATRAWRGYELALRRLWTPRLEHMEPGRLAWGTPTSENDPAGLLWDSEWWVRRGPVPDGATLICACSRADAAAGRCHRVTAARLLARTVWRVMLDGTEVRL